MATTELGLASYGLSFAAGGLSTLSPCVLPLIPILLGSAMAGNRFAPMALGAGLALSFATTGTALASLGQVFDFDPDTLHIVSATLLVAFGLMLLSARLQQRFASASTGVGDAGNNWAASFNPEGLRGQFTLGLLLGIAWSPCVGPTLGVAIGLSSQGQQLAQVALVMLLFGFGAALPIIGLGMLSRQGVQKFRGKLLLLGGRGKQVLGTLMLALGVLMLSGTDKLVEAGLVEITPEWLVRLTTMI
ncbi:MAG: cytochrome c biogenesis protein CcdA [Nitrosomonadales bacterium]|nr:cytochrome c biogenesis protein CcdA [Nitrosomonadales bacterium]